MHATYAEWFSSLKKGDPVRVRFPWDDYTFKEGAMCDGTVTEVNAKHITVEYDRHGRDEWKTQIFFEGGDGGPFMHLEHPTITSIHTIDGYKFPGEI